MAYSDEDGALKKTNSRKAMERQGEAGETEGIRLCSYTKENRFENIDLKINGYAMYGF
jgi:hypothetical protein